MKVIKFYIIIFILSSLGVSNTPHWLVEIDCESDLRFFEVRTLNTYNLDNCSSNRLAISILYINIIIGKNKVNNFFEIILNKRDIPATPSGTATLLRLSPSY